MASDSRILLSIALSIPLDTSLDHEWNKWIDDPRIQFIGRHRISLRAYVRREAAWSTSDNSSIVVISLPVILWSYFPKNDAYTYLSIIRSRNLSLGEESPASALAMWGYKGTA